MGASLWCTEGCCLWSPAHDADAASVCMQVPTTKPPLAHSDRTCDGSCGTQMVVEHLWTLHGCKPPPPTEEEERLEAQRVVRSPPDPQQIG